LQEQGSILRAVNRQNLSTYNVRLELTDSNGIRRETLRPYLAIGRDKDDTQILLGMPTLEKMKIKIDCEKHELQYKLSKNDIRVISEKKFRKHFGNARVYALVQVNSLINPSQKKPSLHGVTVSIPGCIESYADVFVQKNAEQLPPLDLAIETEPGKKPLWTDLPFIPSQVRNLTRIPGGESSQRIHSRIEEPCRSPHFLCTKEGWTTSLRRLPRPQRNHPSLDRRDHGSSQRCQRLQ
jgi:hypothetical protein